MHRPDIYEKPHDGGTEDHNLDLGGPESSAEVKCEHNHNNLDEASAYSACNSQDTEGNQTHKTYDVHYPYLRKVFMDAYFIGWREWMISDYLWVPFIVDMFLGDAFLTKRTVV